MLYRKETDCTTTTSVLPVASMIRMPVPLTYGQRTLVAKKKLDHLVDSKGCFQADRAPIVGRLEPVCCCERCYACLANPLIEKLSSSDHEWTAADQGFVAHDDEEGILLADPEWFSLYPCPSCDCCADDDCRKICGDEDRRRSEDRRYSEAIGAIACDSSPVNKKRMTLVRHVFVCVFFVFVCVCLKSWPDNMSMD